MNLVLNRTYRRRRVASHRRPSGWSLLLQAAISALVAVALPVAAAFWFVSSPTFQLNRLEVSGGTRISEQWVRQTLSPLEGSPVLLLSLDDVRGRLQRHPWVAGVEIRKTLPDSLAVEILERRPVAVLERGDALAYSDRDGRAIALYDPETDPGQFLRITGRNENAETVARALTAAETLGEAHGRTLLRLREIEIVSQDDLELRADGLPFTILVNTERLDQASLKIDRYLPEIRRRYPALDAVDLRFSGQIVIQLPEA